MNWNFNALNFNAIRKRRIGTGAAMMAVVLSSSACQSPLVGFLMPWKAPPVPANSADSVRNPLQKQAEGAYDPRSGGQVQSLESRLKINPQDAALHVDLGRAYANYAIDDLALEQFTRALNLDPNSLDALQGLTKLARKHPEQLAALAPVARAFAEHHPNDAAALSTAGSVLDDSGDLAAAEHLYRLALDLEPRAAWLHNNLGFNLLLQGRLPEAVVELRHALKLDPTSVTTRNNLGVALARQGDPTAALRTFQESGSDRAVAHNNLAVALMEQDRLEESRAELMEALKARNLFEPALENFKLLLEKDQDRQDWLAARPFPSTSLPLPREWMRLSLPEKPAPEKSEDKAEQAPRNHP
jgi:Flp pilus assembly protein TadD